jgi:hypothetical protein
MRVTIVFDLNYGAREHPALGSACWLVEPPHKRALAWRIWATSATNPNNAVFQLYPDLSPVDVLPVDPYDVPAMREAIRTLDADRDPCAELNRRDHAQAERLSPEAYQAHPEDFYRPLSL